MRLKQSAGHARRITETYRTRRAAAQSELQNTTPIKTPQKLGARASWRLWGGVVRNRGFPIIGLASFSSCASLMPTLDSAHHEADGYRLRG